MDASGSIGTVLSYAWTQTSGPTVDISGRNSVRAEFLAPEVSARSTVCISLSLTVSSEGDPCACGDSQTSLCVTILPRASCIGDCNNSGDVTVNELVTMVTIALGDADESACTAGDANGDGQITINELITAVNYVLNGCPAGTATLALRMQPSGSESASAYTVFNSYGVASVSSCARRTQRGHVRQHGRWGRERGIGSAQRRK